MRKVFVGVTAVVLLGVAGGVCVAIHRINANLKSVRRQVAEAGGVPFRLVALDGEDAHLRVTAGFEPLAAPNNFTTGAAFERKLYLAGPAGVAVYDKPDGTPKLLRTGIDLPAAPIVAFASGRLRGEASPSLMAATRGEGLLMFGGGKARQLVPESAADRDMTAVLPLDSGDVLIGTRSAGLLVFDGKTLRVFEPGLADVPVTALAGNESDFWVGTRTRGVLRWHAGELEAFDTTSGLPDAQVEDIAVSDAGVFAGTPLGVAQFADGKLLRVLAKGVFAHELAVTGDTLVIATIDQGVRELSLKASPRASAARSMQESVTLQVTRFFRADDALLAVGTGSLLRRERGGAWQKVLESPTESLADGNVSSLSFAPDGRLWIGYFDRGVDVLDLETNRAQHVEDDHVFCVNRIVPDPQRHTMNVATANGLVLFDGGAAAARVRQVLSRRDGLISDQVTDVGFTSSGMVAATPAGLTFFTAGGAQSLYAFQGLVNNHVYALATEASDGRVVAGTLGGISMLENGAVRQNVTLKNSGLKRNWITAIARVPQKGVAEQGDTTATWFVGTYGGGVVQMDAAGRVSAMEGAPATAVVNPNALLVTPQHVFAGSLEDGLLVYGRASQRWSQVTAGLPSRNVTALAERSGELYVGTENGIVRIAEARLP